MERKNFLEEMKIGGIDKNINVAKSKNNNYGKVVPPKSIFKFRLKLIKLIRERKGFGNELYFWRQSKLDRINK